MTRGDSTSGAGAAAGDRAAASTLYQRAKSIFVEVCDAPGPDRASMIEAACAGDDALRAEVESLLSHDDGEQGLGASDALAPGASVEQYRIVRQIGAGAMGLVYEAQQERPRRTVALKIVRSGVASASLRRRLEHEAAALARLQHPGIAAIYETGVDEAAGAPFFAMELVQGAPLTEHAARAELSIEARVELLATICDAVQHAHQRGVIHRDLKPSNILVDDSGRARVLDFGIARITEPDAAQAQQTMPGQVIGTLAYMSPEQAAGDPAAVDARADIYALGVVGYELLAGAPPLDPFPRLCGSSRSRSRPGSGRSTGASAAIWRSSSRPPWKRTRSGGTSPPRAWRETCAGPCAMSPSWPGRRRPSIRSASLPGASAGWSPRRGRSP